MGWFEERAGLHGTVALVTGGAGGIGLAITRYLAANGVRVAVVDRDEEAIAELVGSVDGIEVVHGDVREPAVLQEVFAAADRRWGRLDTLVSVAGGTFRAAFTDTTPKGWEALLRANFVHVLHACSLAVPRIRAGGRGGSIVNISTIEAHRAAPGYAVYSAAKAAVEQFGRTLAVELAPDGIRVNNVAPDYVPVPNLGRLAPAGAVSAGSVRAAIPMGRAGTPADVSGCVVFLASALASYVTGTTLHPDGGTSASSGWFRWPGEGWSNLVPASLLDAPAAPDGEGRPDSE